MSNPSITVASGTFPVPHPPAVLTPAVTAAPASSRTLSTSIPLAVSYIPTSFAPAGISPAPHPPASERRALGPHQARLYFAMIYTDDPAIAAVTTGVTICIVRHVGA